MLTLEIEFLTGVCFAALPESNPTEQPDWPPQPDRVFSALVAAWGTRGERPDERTALEWLEQQPPPVIEASDFTARLVGISFTPPSDSKGSLEVMPERRRRQPRMFPAAIPHRPFVRLNWDLEPENRTMDALYSLARDTAYVGHSASVVRCRFLLDAAPDRELAHKPVRRRVYPGRLAALERDYLAGRRPLRGESVEAPEKAEAEGPQSVFSDHWIVLEDAGGRCPDLRSIAIVARRLREALLSRYGAAGLPVPELVSGHQADGSPATMPHLAIVPMADAGFVHSEGRLMGLGLVLPRELERQRQNAERDWLIGLDGASSAVERWRTFDQLLGEILQLELGGLGVWKINRIVETRKTSLHSGRYCISSKRWASATPVALDRFPRAKTPEARDEEIGSIIAASCVNIGLPEPRSVRICKHSSVKGAPSAYPSGNAPAWAGWTLPGFLTNRMLIHIAIEFAEPVRGPVILGAGRFVGLGLCLGDRG